MRQITTPAIILRRTNFGEADRIVTFLTPAGKLRALVKGVRRSKSKLAGGIELFSESKVTFIETRGDLARVISTRLEQHWDYIVGDLPRMMFGYEVMKLLDKIIEEEAEPEYYELLKTVLSGLAELTLALPAAELWFWLRLLMLQGHGLNLKTDTADRNLEMAERYAFSTEQMCFTPQPSGSFSSEHIKLLRLAASQPLSLLQQVKGVSELSQPLVVLLKTLTAQYA